ncbi:MAG: DUF3857 domain-containing protein [Bacteroidetes bacterium]|jgi:hypothetical protein|nr:DUF3857 domain-containing protein [Bacteroidota bacterium]
MTKIMLNWTYVAKIALPVFISFLMINPILAQKKPMKFGKIDKQELEMTSYEGDTSAKALILGDYGEVRFEESIKHSLEMVFTRHLRIKIFDQEATSRGDFKIRLYRGQALYGEKIHKIKARTYNLESGKIVETELDKKDIYEERITDYYYSYNFSLPQLKAGSIFEVEYILLSDRLHAVPDWQFQYDIPSVFSEFNFSFPENLGYKLNMKGFLFLDENVQETRTSHLKRSTPNGYAGTMNEYYNHFRINNIPALVTEPYMNHPINYYSKVEIELSSYQGRNRIMENLTTDWEEINKELSNSEYFGLLLNRDGFVKDVAQNIKESTTDTLKMLEMAHQWVRDNIKWNERKSVFTSQTLRKAVSDQSGNSAEVNLLLVLVLNELGFNAQPVISSTRDHGIILRAYPMLSKFNYVLAYCKAGSQEFLMDATDRHLPFYMLPERAINSDGRIIDKNFSNTDFINISLLAPSTKQEVTQLMISEQGNIQARTTIQATQYFAYDLAHEYRQFQNQDAFMDDFESSKPGFELIEVNNNNLSDWYRPLEQAYRYDINNIDQESVKDMIYIQPMLFDRMETNPFKSEERLFPVDFVYPRTINKTIRIVIPQGYQAEELPESTAFALPESSCVYKYTIVHTGTQIQLKTEMQINNPFFGFEDYPLLKEFFNQVVQKEDELIVIKKL